MTRARARAAKVMHFATNVGDDTCTNVLDLAEPSVIKFLSALGGKPNMMSDMILPAHKWDSGARATQRDIEHLKAMVTAAHGAGALYLLGWGSEVRAFHVFNRGNGRLTRAARRWARRWASC